MSQQMLQPKVLVRKYHNVISKIHFLLVDFKDQLIFGVHGMSDSFMIAV